MIDSGDSDMFSIACRKNNDAYCILMPVPVSAPHVDLLCVSCGKLLTFQLTSLGCGSVLIENVYGTGS